MVFVQTRVAEHADLGGDETHVVLDSGRFEAVHQFLAHGFDAHAHFAQLCLPSGTPVGVCQHRGHYGAAMNRGGGVVRANDDFELAQNASALFFVGAQDRQGAHTLAIQTEALGKRGRNKNAQPGVHKLTNHGAILGKSVAKALVGHV